MNDDGTIFGREPAAIAAFVAIAINLAVSWGLHWTPEQIGLVNGLVIAGLALLVRRAVTTTANPNLPVGTSVNSGTATVTANE